MLVTYRLFYVQCLLVWVGFQVFLHDEVWRQQPVFLALSGVSFLCPAGLVFMLSCYSTFSCAIFGGLDAVEDCSLVAIFPVPFCIDLEAFFMDG